jgi:chitin disaccharide deacetylase
MKATRIDADGHSSSCRYLCVCADDFGMTESINEAVFDLIERETLSAVSCMVQRGAWTSGLPGLRGLDASRIDVGLHLDLTPPRPGRIAESNWSSLVLKSFARLLRPKEVSLEIRNQLARFEDALGRAPAFVDGHRHVHQLPVVREALVEAIGDRYGNAKPWIRSTAPLAAPRVAPSKADIIFALGGAKLLELTRRHAIPTTGRLLGVYDFTGDTETYLEQLRRWFAACQTGDILMCHPSVGRAPSGPHAVARLCECLALRSVRFPVSTPAGPVMLAPFSRHARGASAP